MTERIQPSTHAAPEAEHKLTLAQIRTKIRQHKKRLEQIQFEKGERMAAVDNEHSTLTQELADLEQLEVTESHAKEVGAKEKKAEAAEKKRIKKEVDHLQAEIDKKKVRINFLDKGGIVSKRSVSYDRASGEVDHNDAERLEKEIRELEDKIRELKGEKKAVAVEEPVAPPAEEVPAPDEVAAEGDAGADADAEPDDAKEAGEETLADVLARIEAEKATEAEEKPKGPRKLGIVGTDLVEKRAREVAAERMSRNKSELRGISGFFKKIWTHNWMAEYYRAKEMDKVRGELAKAGSTVGEEDVAGVADTRIKGAILDRFLHEAPDLVHEAVGEWKKDGDKLTPEQKAEAQASIKEAIVQYVSNPDLALAEGCLTEAVNRAYEKIYGGEGGFEPLNIADNIKEYAREMRGQVEHGTAIADLDLDFELTFGKAVTGARTEEAYTWRDKLIQKMAASPIGRWVNETTIAGAVCGTMAFVSATRGIGMRMAGLGIVGGFGLGGGLAAMRESQAIKRDRAEHARAMAAGREFNAAESPRRKEVNETIHEMMPTRDAIENLRAFTNIEAGAMDEEQVRNVLAVLAGIEARINISDTKKIDLLSYSSPSNFEVERTELDIERATAKAAAREAYERLGLELQIGTFDQYLASQVNAGEIRLYTGDLEDGGKDGINARNVAFEALKKRRVKSAFVKGVVVAGVAGLVFRGVAEGVSAGYHGLVANNSQMTTGSMGSFAPGMRMDVDTSGENRVLDLSEFEHAQTKMVGLLDGEPQTPAELQEIAGLEETHTTIVNGIPHEITTSTAGVLKVPAGFHVLPSTTNPGEYQILANGHFDSSGSLVGGKVVADHISFETGVQGSTGSYQLTAQSAEALSKAGFTLGSNTEVVESSQLIETKSLKNVTPEEYARMHPDHLNRVHRLGWADNGTVRPDQNELRLSDPVLRPDGKIEISIRGMKPEGSVFAGRHINPQEMIKAGKVEVWVSPTESTQFTPAHIPMGPDGKAVFDANSDIGKLYPFDSKGNLLSRPRFTEAAVIMADNNGIKDGVVCATDEGPNVEKIQTLVTDQSVKEQVRNIVITELGYKAPEPIIDIIPLPDTPVPPIVPEVTPDEVVIPDDEVTPIPDEVIPSPYVRTPGNEPQVDWPMPIPFFVPRTPMERLKLDRSPFIGYYGSMNAKDLERDMPEKKSDPYFYKSYEERGTRKKVDVLVDKEGKKIERSVTRERSRIAEYLASQDDTYMAELNAFAASLEPMSGKCRVAVNIPARYEEKNLANLLDQYVKQDDITTGGTLDKDAFEINIVVNIKEGETPDSSMDIINEWKKNNPGYHVNAFEIAFPKDKANVGMARKYVTDLALLRSQNRRAQAGPLYIASEDADIVSVDKRAMSTITTRFDQKPHLDYLRGVEDRQPEIMQKNELLFVEQRARDYLQAFMRSLAYRPDVIKGSSLTWNRVISGGWNTAYTAESYAQIGGYVSDLLGEDMKIGQKISLLRSTQRDATTGELVPNTYTAEMSGLRASSSPRRFIDSMIKNRNAYDDFADESMKFKTLDELLENDKIKRFAEAKMEHKPDYEKSFNGIANFIKTELAMPHAKAVIRRIMWASGLSETRGDYTFTPESNVQLTDQGMNQIILGVKKYKAENKSELGYRRQNRKK